MATWQLDDTGSENPHTGDLAGGAYISAGRIIVLSIISFGVYWIYWMYRTWKQYRDHTIEMAAESGSTHHPVWHGLTQLVPVYGFFRFHAHCREFKALMQERGIPDSLNLGALTTIVVVSTVVEVIASTASSSAAVSLTMRLVAFFVNLVVLAVTIYVISHVQSNLNRYWAEVDNRLAQSARFGKGEVLVIVLGILLWVGTIAGIVWPS
jgi:hypothetical protein